MTDPLFQRKNGQVYYYQNDHLGTPQRMINANGEVVWEARYSAFGEAEIINEAVTNNLRFPGQYFDGESGLAPRHHHACKLTLPMSRPLAAVFQARNQKVNLA